MLDFRCVRSTGLKTQMLKLHMLARRLTVWLRSCFIPRHNMIGRGERELRGERHGQDGRPSATTVAPSFFMLVLLLPGAAAGQGWSVEARAGTVLSGRWVEDAVIDPGLAGELGSAFTGPVHAKPAAGMAVSIALVGPLRPGAALELAGGWSRAMLRAGNAEDRDLARVQSAHALVGVRVRVSGVAYAGAGFGALRSWGDGVALFAGRAETSPLGEASIGIEPELGGTRVVLRGAAQVHKFTASVLEERGGEPAWIPRLTLSAGLAFGRRAW
jgi:hypothetical protein